MLTSFFPRAPACLPPQKKDEAKEKEDHTVLHLMGQNSLLQRTGFALDDIELE